MKKIDKIKSKKDKFTYDPSTIEPKWQAIWEKEKIYHPDLKTANSASPKRAPRGKPFYNLMMFPYPSAEGLHVGSMYTFSGVDVYGRFKRMQGYDVFEPIGLDGFGIHSENHAIKMGTHPVEHAKTTEKTFYRQLKEIGNGFAWEQKVETYDPDYYKWTQWLFAELFKMGLAYRKKAPVNFCPSCKTVLADEQVVTKSKIKDQKSKISENQHLDQRKSENKLEEVAVKVCERCNTEIVMKDLEQWFFKITQYADRLLGNIDKLNWTEKVKIAQREWIGKKEGIEISYPIVLDSAEASLEQYSSSEVEKFITVFTTRPDTNFGATFIALAPEHILIDQILKQVQDDKRKEIKDYVEATKKKTDIDRQSEGREKSGVFTGFYAINQLTDYKMPIWVSDFVLMGFGTGAVVGVPGHDKRDFEFASKFGLEIIRVVEGSDGDKSEITKIEQVQEEEGTMVNSDFLNGMDIHKATEKIMDYMEEKGFGKRVATYHLRDWLISRQRYWGPPIPMIFCKSCAEKGDSWFTASKTKKSSQEEDLGGLTRFGYKELILRTTKSVADNDNLVNPQNTKGVDPEGVEPSRPIFLGSAPKPGGPTPYLSYKKSEVWVNGDWNSAGWFPEENLPVELPYIKDFKPLGTGKAPLGNHPEFYETRCPNCGADAVRETDVSDTFLDSSWYFFRYLSTDRKDVIFDPEVAKKWLPVHMYIGGAEHAVMHLLYARFITMAIHDMGLTSFEEPFKRFYAHGLIIKDGAKMSKSKGNVVNPDVYIKKYGADTLRTYLRFLGPFDQTGDFRDEGIEGMSRFIQRVWKLISGVISIQAQNHAKPDAKQRRLTMMHLTIKNVTHEMEELRFNTSIAHLMSWYNFLAKQDSVSVEEAEVYLKLLAPFAPHMTEELYQLLRNSPNHAEPERQTTPRQTRLMQEDSVVPRKVSRSSALDSIHLSSWPEYDEKYLVADTIKIPVQVNGKLRGMLEVAPSEVEDRAKIEELARRDEKVAVFLKGQKIKKAIYVEGKVLNFVV